MFCLSSPPLAPTDSNKPVKGGHRNHRRSTAPASPAGTVEGVSLPQGGHALLTLRRALSD